jgi:protein arginine kinase activator
MICQKCQKNEATVQVTEIAQVSDDAKLAGSAGKVVEQNLCELCAQALDLPHAPLSKLSQNDIWKLLQVSANQTRKKPGPACPDCGMTLEEFRKKGRLGCPRDYEVFRVHLTDVLERVHGAVQHSGRIPGLAAAGTGGGRIEDLRKELENAIRAEAYESAARLRDEIRAIEEGSRA